MNFFEHQDQARKHTKQLILLFALSLLLITVTVYLAAIVTFSTTTKGWTARSPRTSSVSCAQLLRSANIKPGDPRQAVLCPPETQTKAVSWWNPALFLTVATGTLTIVGLGSLYKIQMLKGGGRVIAQELGGRLLLPETADTDERQLLNVVEEMAIAAGIAVPAVYLLDQEPGINAFAAGFTPNDAVIGVTRGTLEQLTRDELQGVIGHEYSHILNGDMRLNLRLVGLLHGLLLIYITGRIVIDWRSRDEKGNGMLFFGIVLTVVGSLGLFCGRLIQSAISRQREFLADASSVQFTRNPSGIAGALRKIAKHQASSFVRSPQAEGNSHLFFGSALRVNFLSELFATHPPLGQRIRRLEGVGSQFAGAGMGLANGAAGAPLAMGFAGSPVTTAGTTTAATIPARPQQVVAAVGTVTPDHYAYAQTLLAQLPEPLQLGVREQQSAIAIVYGLLLDTPGSAVRTKQLDWLRQVEPVELIDQVMALSASIDTLEARCRLPLLDLLVPVLRQRTDAQHQRLYQCIHGLAQADGRWSLSEFVLYAVLRHRLQPPASNTAEAAEFTTIASIWSDCLLLLAALAQVGQTGADAIAYAFRSGAFRLPGAGQQTLPETPPACNLRTLKQSLDRLGRATPKLKQAIVDACAHTVLLDNTVTVPEAELLRAIVILLDCPLPPFLKTGSKVGSRV